MTLGDNYSDSTPKVWSIKEIIDEPDFIKIKNVHFAKDNIKRTEDKPQTWGKIFVKDLSSKELLSKTHKKLLKLRNKKIAQLKKWPENLNTLPIKIHSWQICT